MSVSRVRPAGILVITVYVMMIPVINLPEGKCSEKPLKFNGIMQLRQMAVFI